MKELIFVYNANSDKLSLAKDYVHKIVSPGTYKCNLCKITYGGLGMKKEWGEFLKTLKISFSFLHKDEFKKVYPDIKIKLPVVFVKQNGNLKMLVSASEINKKKNVKELKKLISEKL